MPDEDYRSRSRRICGKWEVIARGSGVAVLGDVRDLSTTGFYFLVPARLSVGQRIAADIATSPTESVRAVVEIVREEEVGEGRFGYGARFAAMTEGDRVRLGDSLTAMRRKELAGDFAPQIAFTSYRAA